MQALSLTGQSVASSEQPFASNRVTQTVAFDGGADSGAVGTVALFTVTGSVFVYVIAICIENLTEAGATATVEVGIAGITAGLISQTNAVNIDNGEVWLDNSPAAMEVFSSIGGGFIASGADIILTVGAQNVDDGTLAFYCFWTPLAAGSTVVAA